MASLDCPSGKDIGLQVVLNQHDPILLYEALAKTHDRFNKFEGSS
jgi:hypothetical protein